MLEKILKNKEKRDTILLIFMSTIMVVFLLYIFIPSGEKEKKTDNGNVNKHKIEKKSADIEKVEGKKENFSDKLNKKIKFELNSVYLSILISNDPFESYWVETLEKVFDDFKNYTLDRFHKFSFFDLNEITTLPVPEEYNDSLKFNIVLSLFLIKLKEDGIVKKLEILPRGEFEKTINLDFYRLINYEVEEDYQLMPVIFYFTVLLKRLPIFPAESSLSFFKEKIKHIRDLTTSKYLIRIRELLCFSETSGKYRVQWVEHDAIGSDDKGVYGNLNFKTFDFLGQSYLVFPDAEIPGNNFWIKGLCEADSGDIELTDLKIMSEDPSDPMQVKKILYTPISSQFVVLLKEYESGENDGFLNSIVKKRITAFEKNLTIIDFSVSEREKKSFETQLDQFGDYLKKNNPST